MSFSDLFEPAASFERLPEYGLGRGQISAACRQRKNRQQKRAEDYRK